ncbi:MAG TPA: ShlB/FhaC/HecB family hemolysin secretion/activation protein [Solimonas sp.]|nr:ShlB/FhaC/HecB family hemolysin secretion/activation protein [Solimonas sp.]
MNADRSWERLGIACAGGCLLLCSVLAAAAEPAAPAGPSARFDIWEIAVDGNSVLDDEAIEQAIAPFLGPGRTPDAIDKAREALENVYRERGYRTVSVAIPRQNVREGVVVLQVTEGRVGHLNVVGSEYHSIEKIKAEATSLAEGSVPNFNQVREDLVSLNRQADRRVAPSLKAGATPGTVDVDLVVDDDLPLHGSLEFNNRHSQDTSFMRGTASLSYANLWQRGHSLSLSYTTAPLKPSEVQVWFGSYLSPLRDSPWSLLFNALQSDSNVATVGGIEVVGNGKSFGLRAVRQLEGGEGFYPSISLGVDYKKFRNLTMLGSSSFQTPATYYPLTLGYSAFFRGERHEVQGDLSMSFASPQLGSDSETLQLNRFSARGQMFYLRGSVSDTLNFANGMQLWGRLAGQTTDQPLISNEQFSAGGMDTAAGYLEAEAQGDWGLGAQLELRSPSIGEGIRFGSAVQPIQELRLHAFLHGADLHLRGPLPDASTPDSTELLSTGLGLRLRLYSHFNTDLAWALPLIDGPTTNAHESRALFRVWSHF